jgi:crotonobetainyl-CoA:carnitine CoA-transferase CaiB-like acyl-CoA transferase
MGYNENRFKYVFQNHEDNVRSYFQDRPEDILILDITAGDQWEKLCKFIGKPAPKIEFPHVNKSLETYDSLEKRVSKVLNNLPRNKALELLMVMDKITKNIKSIK